MQIEDPAPALKKLRDRHDLAAMADLPWAVEAARTVSSPPDYNIVRCLLSAVCCLTLLPWCRNAQFAPQVTRLQPESVNSQAGAAEVARFRNHVSTSTESASTAQKHYLVLAADVT